MLSPEMLSDRAEIGDIITRLAYTQSDRDFTALTALFADEIILDTSSGEATRVSPSQLVERVRSALTGFSAVLYTTSNVLTNLDGDTARSRVTVHAYYHLPTEQGICDYSLGRNNWELDLRRAGGQWVIAGWKLGPVAPPSGYGGLSKLAKARSAASED